ncbi:PIN domain-containing protein [Rhizobium sp. P32RR-XVIII]|uniref:PIN domain-containing protein n=1 Tax=Rhizobium sp. P32RR-XVIII TaxID=2726738 RepID=UPI001456CA6E|nr:PIN domain-containing protein [Rhizobium sp. P32RR-XVIII]NLS02572.1 PIN domain-containing protein [Rhizobium sp. P32RR-XVIII]
MAAADSFLDTNILVYAFTEDPRAEAAQSLLLKPFVLSVQTLNEFANVGRKKLNMSWADLHLAIADVITMAAAIAAIDERTTISAINLAERYNLNFYDAAMIAAALQMNCVRFYSEDLQHGLVIDGHLTVINPFR